MSGKVIPLVMNILAMLKTDVTHYCNLETVDGGRSIVADDGSLVSIVKFEGSKSVMGRDAFERLVSLLDTSLSVFFKSRGHQLGVIFRRDLDGRRPLEKNAQMQRATAGRLNLAVNDLIEESVEKYAEWVYDEECYLAFWTRPSLLDAIEIKLARDEVNKIRRDTNWPAAKNAQNILRPISYLLDRHSSFVSKITDDLGSPEFGCAVEILNVEEALYAIKANVYPDYTPNNWRASIPGKGMNIRWKTNNNAEDLSEFLYPNLPEQIMVGQAQIGKRGSSVPDPTTVKVGSRLYAPIVVKVPPREPQYFNDLFKNLNRAETTQNGKKRAVPYSISFMLESDGMSGTFFKGLLASILAITSEENRNMNLTLRDLKERKRDGECIVKLRMAAMTWSDTDNDGLRELTLRKSKLWRTIESWGNPEVTEKTGNPMDAFQTNSLALSPKHIGEASAAPLADALAMLPLTRPSSPFAKGSTIYRSEDGKILRYQRFSSEQTTWITLMAGKPGSGKSVLMNNNNFESCLMPGLVRLPYIGILDIGVSSSGFIDLIRDSLPENLKHLALYKRIQNSEDDCINVMDTPLGKREPLPKDREFIKNFLSILVTPPERRGKPYEGMSNFVGRIIDLAYAKKSDKYEMASPNTYTAKQSEIIDIALREIGFVARPATTYWEIVDELFKAGRVYEAEVAQRFAVPTLNDLASVASSEEVAQEYGDILMEGNRPMIKTFMTGVREAVSDYPVFAKRTRFDIGSARVMSLDLQDVALTGGDSAHKQTALMYMIGRQSFMKKVAFSKEDIPHFDPLYRTYYTKLINELVDENKVLAMDEYHKTGGHSMLELQVLTDGREARKWNLEIILASQLMEDFGSLTKIATAKFILDSGTEETRSWLRANIGLTSVEESALVNYVHGANAKGSTFLAIFETKSGKYSQLFTMTAGPMRLWALSTTAEDRKLRSLLYDAMPRQDARRLLAEYFPGGSCKKLVERRKEEMFAGTTFVDDEQAESVIEAIAKEMVDTYFTNFGLIAAA